MNVMTKAPSLEDELQQVLMKALDAAEEPLTTVKLRDRLFGRFRKQPEREVDEILEKFVQDGKAFRYEPSPRGKKPRYWSKPINEYARGRMLSYLAERPLTRTALMKLRQRAELRGCSQSLWEAILKQLRSEGIVKELPPLVGGRSKFFSIREPDPCDYLAPVIIKICEKLAGHGVSQADVLDAVAAIAARHSDEGRKTSRNETADHQDMPSDPEKSARQEVSLNHETHQSEITAPDLVLECASDFPGAKDGALVSIPRLRDAVGERLNKAEFESGVLQLYNWGRIHLHQTDHPGGLSEDERKKVVRDADGRYFVGLVLR